MCWYSNRFQKVKIAKRNIKILKVLYIYPSNPTVLIPYFFGASCRYTFEKETTPIKIKAKRFFISRTDKGKYFYCYKILKGYHSYSIKSKYTIFSTFIDINYDSYHNDEIFGKRICLVEGIIPKGTKYYLNECKEYVSERIILKKIIGRTY